MLTLQAFKLSPSPVCGKHHLHDLHHSCMTCITHGLPASLMACQHHDLATKSCITHVLPRTYDDVLNHRETITLLPNVASARKKLASFCLTAKETTQAVGGSRTGSGTAALRFRATTRKALRSQNRIRRGNLL